MRCPALQITRRRAIGPPPCRSLYDVVLRPFLSDLPGSHGKFCRSSRHKPDAVCILLRIERHGQCLLSAVDKHLHAESVQHDPKPEVPIPVRNLCAAHICSRPACPGHRAVQGQQRLLGAIDQIRVMLLICRQGEDDCPGPGTFPECRRAPPALSQAQHPGR